MEELNLLSQSGIKLLKKYELLDKLIYSILLDKAIEDVIVDKETIENIKKSIMKKNNQTSNSDFLEWLSQSNMDEKNFFEGISKPMKINSHSLKEYSHMVESRFLKRKDELDLVTYSLIRVTDYYLAQELFYRIQDNPSSFGELASKHSLGLEKDSNGILGPLPIKSGHPIMQEKIKESKPGEVRSPIQIDNIWIILRVENKKITSLDDEMKLLMAKEIFEESLKEKTLSVISKLSEAKVS